jgi:hypothetical protein
MDDLRQVSVAKSGELLRALEAMHRTHFATSSQAMRVGFTSNTSTPHNDLSLTMKCLKGWTRLSAPLSLCSRLFGSKCFHLRDLMPSQCRFNAQSLVEHVMASLAQTVFPQEKTRYTSRLNVHLYSCQVHFSKVTEQFSSRIGYCMFPTHLMVSTWPRRTSGYLGVSRLDSLVEVSPSPKNY